MSKNKMALIVGVIVCLPMLLFGGCFAGFVGLGLLGVWDEPVAEQEKTEQKEEQPVEKNEKVVEKEEKKEKIEISNGGLGDSLSTFETKYGSNKGEEILGIMKGRFQNDYIHTSFVSDKAYDVRLQFSQSSKKVRSKEEAFNEAKKFTPSDAEEIKRFTEIPSENYQRDVIVYKSKSIEKLFNEDDYFLVGNKDAEQGTFVVVLQKYEDGYGGVMVIIGDGTNL